MTTINNSPFTVAEDRVEGFDVLSGVKENPWTPNTFWEGVCAGAARIGAWFCCLTDELDQIEADGFMRDRIRQQMQITLSPSGRPVPMAAAFEIYRDTGYDMASFRYEHARALAQCKAEARAEVLAQQRGDVIDGLPEYTPHVQGLLLLTDGTDTSVFQGEPNEESHVENVSKMKWSTKCAEEGLLPHFEELPTHRKVSIMPRFVAALVVVLRTKFGRLGVNEANRLLIEREYLRICREGSVRLCDVAHHSQWVYNAYFNEGVFEEMPLARVRVPSWLRRLIGSSPVVPPQVC
jgi:hypothetical protein